MKRRSFLKLIAVSPLAGLLPKKKDAYNIGSSSYSCTVDIPAPLGKINRRSGIEYIDAGYVDLSPDNYIIYHNNDIYYFRNNILEKKYSIKEREGIYIWTLESRYKA